MEADRLALRADIAFWSDPLVADCIGMAYRAFLDGHAQLVAPLVKQHRRVWSHIVAGDAAKAAEARGHLVAMAKLCRIREDEIDDVDTFVLDELSKVVSLRFRASRENARSYGAIMAEAAHVLTQTRACAA